MAEAMKMRATMDGNVVDVKVLIQHPMETGLMKDKKTDKLIPAFFINQVVATLNGKTVLDAQWGVGIAQNPFHRLQDQGWQARRQGRRQRCRQSRHQVRWRSGRCLIQAEGFENI